MSFIIPTEELTLTDKKRFREGAVEAAIKRGVTLKVATTREQAIVRHAQNIADFACALEQWNTAVLAAVGTVYSVFQGPALPLATPTLGNRQLAVFYKATVVTAPLPVSLLSFRLGAAAGTTKAVFDLEQLEGYLITGGYFSEPVVYDPGDVLNIVVTCRVATGLLSRVILGCYIVEATQVTIS